MSVGGRSTASVSCKGRHRRGALYATRGQVASSADRRDGRGTRKERSAATEKAPKAPKAKKDEALRVLTVAELDGLSVSEEVRDPWVHGKILIPRPRGRFALTPRAEKLIPLLQGDRAAPPARRRRAPQRKALLAAMIEEACIDAYDEYEQATGFHCLLEEHLELPFDTELLGQPVTVVGLSVNDHASIDAICKRGRRRQRVPLESLPVPERAPPGADWIAAYRQWLTGSG